MFHFEGIKLANGCLHTLVKLCTIVIHELRSNQSQYLANNVEFKVRPFTSLTD